MFHFSILPMLLIIIIVIIISIVPGIIMAMPRLPADSSSHGSGIAAAAGEKPVEFNYDKWRSTSSSSHSQLNAEQPDPASSPSSFIEQIGRMELVQSIMRFVERLGFGTGEQYDEKMTQRIERQSPATKSVEEQHREIFGKRRHFDSPMRANANIVRSPTIRRISAKEQPQISSSIDARPMTIAKPSEEQRYEQQRPATAAVQPQLNGMASFHEAIGKEWKQALFGRGGLLTEVFNFVNDKRKEDLAKQQAAPNLNDKASTEFSRIVDALLRKAKSGNFDEEPLPEIPFIGICNRLSCADIYKALDQFRKSEFFSNFQTAISLLQDPKGLDMIGELLANPELIENFSGPESVGDLFGTTKKAASKSGNGDGTRRVEIAENTDAENIGVDFSSMIDGPNNNSNVKMPPSIASSIDSAAPDYYSFAEDKVGSKAEDKTPKKERVVTPKQRGGGGANAAKSVQSTKTSIDFSRELPEISESIDGGPPEDEDIPGGDMLVFEKNEWLPSASSANSNGTIKKQQFVLTPLVDVRVGQDKKKVAAQQTVHVHATTQISRPRSKAVGGEHNRTTTTTTEKTFPSRARMQTNSSSSSSTTTNRKTATTTPPATTTTTRRNFRRDDDYYSMYYDGESG